ncbi:choline dehydrogenase, partial [Mesorhizobium sp. M1A.F.Ca.IN.022.05.2.1]
MDEDSFDYIIIGAGTAGCLLADRLSADGKSTVCVIEAGGMDTSPYFNIPAGFLKTVYNPRTSWQFESPALPALNGRSMSLPQGRAIGGSSSVNGMVYNRGQRHDYDTWAQLGNRGWGYDDVLAYFRKSENRLAEGDPEYRGKDGPLAVSDMDWPHVLFDAFIEAAQQIGIPRNRDHNGREQAGVGLYQRTIRNGRRVSSAQAFLRPALRRKNVELRTKARIVRIVLDGRRAVGVVHAPYDSTNGPGTTVRARREIILAAGTINSPRILQLSGIGPEDVLVSAGVEVRHALSGVGENFRDHYVPRMVARVKGTLTINEKARGPRLGLEIAKWMLGRPSVLGLQPAMGHIFWKSDEALDFPDLQVTFTPASYKQGYIGLLDDFPGMTCGAYQQRPES